ncbi:MAG: hypothetical protein WCO12_03170 [bacterium]
MKMIRMRGSIEPTDNVGKIGSFLEESAHINQASVFMKHRECRHIEEIFLFTVETGGDLATIDEFIEKEDLRAPSLWELILSASSISYMIGEEEWLRSMIISKDPYHIDYDKDSGLVGIISKGEKPGKVHYSEYLASLLLYMPSPLRKYFVYVRYTERVALAA